MSGPVLYTAVSRFDQAIPCCDVYSLYYSLYGGLSLSDESFPNGGAHGAFAKPSRSQASVGMAEGFSARDVLMKRS